LPEEPAATPEAQIDRAAELQKKWGTERGQLWLIGQHRLLCGDSTNRDDVLRLMNGQRACLFATDPPYLVAYDGTNHPHKWNDSEEIKRRKNKDWSDNQDAPMPRPVASLRSYRWQRHCRGLFHTPMAA